jgi:hypothetical protein
MLDISLKINRKELFLDEIVYQKLNAIKKHEKLVEVYKKTIVSSKLFIDFGRMF